jgi:propanediol utilization protein
LPQHDRRSGGRPRKYAEASQPVTITLPQTTLRQLEQVDPDRGRAIVKLAKNASFELDEDRPVVEVVEIGGGTALVVVGGAAVLKKIPFVRLVEVAVARHLIALLPGHGIHELEVALSDLVEDRDVTETNRELLSGLLTRLRNFRKTESVSTAQILLLQIKPYG